MRTSKKNCIQVIVMVTLLISNYLSAGVFERRSDIQIQNLEEGDGVTGGAFIDYDRDGLLDISVFCVPGLDYMYHNEGNGQFALVQGGITDFAKASSGGYAWGDWDNNGYPDLLVTSYRAQQHFLSNQGNGLFVQVYDPVLLADGSASWDADWVDMDNDGWLDLQVFNASVGGAGVGQRNFFYINHGSDGLFQKMVDTPLSDYVGQNVSAAWSDIDSDNDLDLYLTCWGQPNALFENLGNLQFTQIADAPMIHDQTVSIGCSWGDYDNDGDMDLYVINGVTNGNGLERNGLFQNQGDGSFVEITEGAIVTDLFFGWCSSWVDVDNDADLDMVVANEYHQDVVYLNSGDGTFERQNVANETTRSGGMCLGDYDSDGDMDLLLFGVPDEANRFYDNTTSGMHWLQIQCIGTHSNRDGIGAFIKVLAEVNGKRVWQTRQITSNDGLVAMNNGMRAHFGLADAQIVDSLIISWPSGKQNVLTQVAVDQLMTVEEASDNHLRSAFRIVDSKGNGFSELAVQFQDESQVHADHPITSWAWDFDSDGTVDSNEQNPEYTFRSQDPRHFNVTLTTTNDALTSARTQSNYIFLKGHVPEIDYGPLRIDMGDISETNSDTSFVVYNRGEGADTISFEVPKNLVNAVSLNPSPLSISAFDSQRVSIHINTNELIENRNYNMRMKVYSKNSDDSDFSRIQVKFTVAPSSGAIQQSQKPEQFHLYHNYPNPFNPETRIAYYLPEASHVFLKVYNSLGHRVRTLANTHQAAGSHSVIWDGKNDAAQLLANGTYIVQLKANQTIQNIKVVLLK